jgi:hypothetical protein
VEDEAGVSTDGGREPQREGGGLLEAFLRRLTRPEIAEGALGDLEEAHSSQPGGGAAGARRAFERLRLVIAFGRERIGSGLSERLRTVVDSKAEEDMRKLGFEAGSLGLWLLGQWILASAVGWLAGLAAAVALFLAVQSLAGIDSDRFLAFAALPCLGASVGLAQSLVMGRWLARPRDWFWATLAGHILAMITLLVPWFRRFSGPEIVGNTAMLALIGAAIGGTQGWILRRRFPTAAVWVPATSLGFLSFLWIVANPVSNLARFVLATSVMGAAASALPGIVLVWLVGRERAGAAPTGAAASEA